MKPTHPKPGTQAYKVLRVLLDANGAWVSKKVFIYDLHLTQSGARIFELEHDYHWKIEHSEGVDMHGFKSYRIVQDVQPAMFELAGIPVIRHFNYDRT